MTATQAPTPGPLTSESVKLLVKGDLLRVGSDEVMPIGSVVTFTELDFDDTELRFAEGDGLSWMIDRFAFIGRPEADGWMPWSGGEPTITDPTVDIEVRLRNGEMHLDRSPAFDWTYDPEPHPFDIIAFRLAPTAPVEASGSEREDRLNGVKSMLERVVGPTASVRIYEHEAKLILSALGETRESYDRSDVRYGLQLIADEECDEVAASYYAKKAIALLSARPLALGGQQGEALTLLAELLDGPSQGAFHGINDALRAKLETIRQTLRSTTPARAEAKDEGAAGSDCASCFGSGKDAGSQFNACPDCDGKGRIARAHPSPTPADYADRVRIAVGALETAREDIVGWFEAIDAEVRVEHEMHVTLKDDLANIDQALAALKSTAAKEGGE